MIRAIANADLRAEDVPETDAPWDKIFEFALSFDGYSLFGGSGPCAELANETAEHYQGTSSLPDSLDLTRLRVCLFYEQRRWHHFGYGPTAEAREYFGALLDAIRAGVSGE